MGISKTQFVDGISQTKGYVDNRFNTFNPNLFDENGWGNVRFYNGKMQQNVNGVWTDAVVDQANQYIINMMPNPMKSFIVVYDSIKLSYKLKFEEPDDTIINDQIACMVEGVKIMRKLGSAPINQDDGIFVANIQRKDFGQHVNEWLSDENNHAQSNEIWYYKAFPYSTTGFYDVSNLNEGFAVCKDYEFYAFRINQAESDPAYMISYPDDCDNTYYNPVYMDYTNDVFNYGDWAEAFFMNVKPCMVKYDGTVDYYLDPNDYTRKLGGEVSDVTNTNYEGNCMIEIPKVYYKGVVESSNVATYYFSNKKLDNDYKCWAHLDADGNEIPYCYISAYATENVNDKARSISGLDLDDTSSLYSDIKVFADKNNLDPDTHIWTCVTFSDIQLINFLLMLIGRSTHCQQTFGTGATSTGNNIAPTTTDFLKAGTGNFNGLFYGKNINKSVVKVFGIENWWGNMWKVVDGAYHDDSTHTIKVKLTYSDADGASIGYNTTGNGYLTAGNTAKVTGYFKSYLFGNYYMTPKDIGASSTTYYCDGFSYSKSSSMIVFGRRLVQTSNTPSYAGMFSYGWSASSTTFIRTYLSCKPMKGV